MDVNLDDLTEKYVRLRDKKAEVEKRHKDELARFNKVLADLESIFLEHLNSTNLQSLATAHATVYKGVHTSVKLADKDAFREEVSRRVKEQDDWSLIDLRPSKSLVSDMFDAGEAVPGVNISRTQYVRVNRKQPK